MVRVGCSWKCRWSYSSCRDSNIRAAGQINMWSDLHVRVRLVAACGMSAVDVRSWLTPQQLHQLLARLVCAKRCAVGLYSYECYSDSICACKQRSRVLHHVDPPEICPNCIGSCGENVC